MFYFEVADQYPKYKTSLSCSANNCGKSIASKQPLFVCSECTLCFHPHCKGIIGQHITRKASEPYWFCSDVCQRNNAGSANIMVKLHKHDEEFSEMKAMMAEIKKSQEFISSEFERLTSEYKRVVDENKELLHLLKSSNTTNKNQQEQINKLESAIDEVYQEKLACNLIIAGLPNEELLPGEITKQIFKTLECDNCIEDVAQVQYLKQKFRHNRAPGGDRIDSKLLITFKDKLAKIKVQDKKKNKMVFLNQVGYNLPIDKQIYFRDHLTPHRLNLYREARKVNKTINYKYLWISKSLIYFRKEEKAPPQSVFCFIMTSVRCYWQTTSIQKLSINYIFINTQNSLVIISIFIIISITIIFIFLCYDFDRTQFFTSKVSLPSGYGIRTFTFSFPLLLQYLVPKKRQLIIYNIVLMYYYIHIFICSYTLVKTYSQVLFPFNVE